VHPGAALHRNALAIQEVIAHRVTCVRVFGHCDFLRHNQRHRIVLAVVSATPFLCFGIFQSKLKVLIFNKIQLPDTIREPVRKGVLRSKFFAQFAAIHDLALDPTDHPAFDIYGDHALRLLRFERAQSMTRRRVIGADFGLCACSELGIAIETTEYAGTDPVPFVRSENKHRRHLTAMQSALVVSLAQDWADAAHKGGTGANQHANKEQIGREEPSAPVTVTARSAKSGASYSTQKRADKLAKASPELAKQVAHGEVTMTEATRSKAKARKLESHFLSWLFNITGDTGF